jgi:hypothetical protein
MADELLITLDTEHVPVTGQLRQRRVLTTAQTLSSALGVDVNSTLAFIDNDRLQRTENLSRDCVPLTGFSIDIAYLHVDSTEFVRTMSV